MGKDKGSDPGAFTGKVDEFAQAAADIAKQLFDEATPLRKSLTDQLGTTNIAENSDLQAMLNKFLPGGSDLDLDKVQSQADKLFIDPGFAQNFGSLKAAQEDQFNRARQNVIDTGQSGGALTGSLTNLEGQRALGLSQTLGDLANQETVARNTSLDRALGISNADIQRAIGLGGAQTDINQRNVDRALNLASGGSTNALQGFGIGGNLAASSAATNAGQANANQAAKAAGKGSAGEALGTLGSAFLTRKV